MDPQPILVGRERERSALRSVVERAAAGQPGLLLVHGEAGIGKTSLVREAAVAARAEGSHVLQGQCLRFGADVTSYLPFTQALTHWLRTSGGGLGARLAPTGRLDDLVPALSNGAPGVALLQLGEVLDALQADRPTLVVLDDLQWADPSSLDVVSYLVAGFETGQRLAVLATYRDTDLGEGHRLHGWLADADRMPAVARLELARMDVWAIEEMLLASGATLPDGVTATEILRRSGGNPYLATLLMDEPGSETSLGVTRGTHLAEALLASWHRLSGPARRVMQVLAVAGAPVALPVLHRLASAFDLDVEGTVTAVHESTVEGITITTDTGAIWFRHPLLAETIAGTLSRWEVAGLHADLAAAWEAAVAVDERDRANALALHHVAAGDRDQGLHWSLRAADEAQSIRSWDEVASHLSTAVSLIAGPGAVGETDGHIDLLLRAGQACEIAGDDRAAVRHYEAALERVDRQVDPLLASRILLELHILRDLAGYGTQHLSLTEPREVLALTDATPNAPERALAHAHLAFAEVFNGEPTAVEHAETAVRLAERSDDPRAMTWALAVRAQTRWGTEEGVVDGERAFALAWETDDPQLVCRSAIFLSNSYQSTGRYADSAAVTHRSYRLLLDRGQFDHAASVGALAAWWDFILGRWDEVRPLVRELLTIARSDNTAGAARNVAALLTAHEGNHQAAALHLRRAKELLPTAAPVGDTLTATEVLVSIVAGHPLRALELIEGCMAEAVQIDPVAADEYLEYASRAALALADLEADSPDRLAAARSLERIELARSAGPTPFLPAAPQDVVHPALGALHAAQRAQFLGRVAELPALWDAACIATERAGLQYEHARALHSLARHLLVRRLDRRRASDLLAQARDIAGALDATPLAHDIDALALQSHIHLPRTSRGEASASARPATIPASSPLTRRELQVLEGVVEGETYAQIAARLFISDKTVSTHVSNLLRKTGTSSRIELADLARRGLGAPGG